MVEFRTKQKRFPFITRYKNSNINNIQIENQLNEQVIYSTVKKYIWIINDGGWIPEPFFIVYCSEKIVNKIEHMDNEDKLYFITDMLYKIYPKYFSELFNNHEFIHSLLYYSMLEDYKKAYKRMIKEKMDVLRDRFCYYDEKTLMKEAMYRVNKDLENLPIFVI